MPNIAIPTTLSLLTATLMLSACSSTPHHDSHNGHEDQQPQTAVSDTVIEQQRQALAANSQLAGPQSPRDIDSGSGSNPVQFASAPERSRMNLCNIHLHKGAEHKGGEFTRYAGNGDGHGYGSGYLYNGQLSAAERQPLPQPVCHGEHGALQSGDTIEVHYVYSSAEVAPGYSLNACFNSAINNPQLRVETQVYVLVNDRAALDFSQLAAVGYQQGKHQATGIPANTGTPVSYEGSTTGPKYNEQSSPFQVSWNVRPKVAKVDINSMQGWCDSNPFDEKYAHGVRNLVINPALLAPFGN
ncbi:delta-class carbonic anhydrase [Oceanobacter mangrovi]|uniref:delta-class carbonic anhydrase n=1 Tax=Oceanobacter mangrovi TaxID=2862510 RepID=UPI001FE6895D|nr:delta-class carbonic anhydrase [Oceanobacter mangrovi]